MKTTQSQVAGQENPNTDQRTDFPLPDPMEIARLAAILRPDAPSSPDALKAAVKCYFEVVLFVREQALRSRFPKTLRGKAAVNLCDFGRRGTKRPFEPYDRQLQYGSWFLFAESPNFC